MFLFIFHIFQYMLPLLPRVLWAMCTKHLWMSKNKIAKRALYHGFRHLTQSASKRSVGECQRPNWYFEHNCLHAVCIFYEAASFYALLPSVMWPKANWQLEAENWQLDEACFFNNGLPRVKKTRARSNEINSILRFLGVELLGKRGRNSW